MGLHISANMFNTNILDACKRAVLNFGSHTLQLNHIHPIYSLQRDSRDPYILFILAAAFSKFFEDFSLSLNEAALNSSVFLTLLLLNEMTLVLSWALRDGAGCRNDCHAHTSRFSPCIVFFSNLNGDDNLKNHFHHCLNYTPIQHL